MWYAAIDPPPFGIRVRVRFKGEVFEAARLLDRRSRKPKWMTVKAHQIVYLPEDPDAWQPLDPARWRAPLPDPEPPAFIEFAKQPSATPYRPVDGRPWWRLPWEVSYSEPGSVTPHEAEGRLCRALWTAKCEVVPSPSGPPSNSSWLARMIAKLEIESGERKRPTFWHDRFTPTPRDVSDYHEAISWARALSDQQYDVIALRAANPPYSWVQIAEMPGFRCRPETVRHMHRIALGTVTMAANRRLPTVSEAA